MYSVDSYELAGRFLLVSSSGEWAAQKGRNFLRGFHLKEASVRENEADCIISLRTNEPPPTPNGARPFEITNGTCYPYDGKLVLLVDGSYIRVEAGSPAQVSAWFGQSEHARRRESWVNVMSYVVPAALRRCGLYEVHAAGVVEPNTETGFLLIGKSNSGKSSLTVRLANAGWKYLTDDMVVIKENDSGVEAIALRRLFAVSPSSVEACGLPHGALGEVFNSDPSKRRLEPDIVFPRSFARSCIPRVICFLGISDSRHSKLEPISGPDGLIRLLKHCPWSSFDEVGARQFLGALSRLVMQAKCFLLSAGRDVFDQPSLASELLSHSLEN